MESRQKWTVAVLVLLVVLCAVALGVGVNQPSRVPEDAREVRQPNWTSLMAGLLAPLAPALDPARLEPAPGCRRGDGGFQLSRNNHTCEIRISDRTDDSYQTATLAIRGVGTAVNIEFDAAAADTDAVTVHWSWEGAASQDDPIRLVVLETGGTLTLRCVSCPQGRSATVDFQ